MRMSFTHQVSRQTAGFACPKAIDAMFDALFVGASAKAADAGYVAIANRRERAEWLLPQASPLRGTTVIGVPPS